jgi:hypothetical protein
MTGAASADQTIAAAAPPAPVRRRRVFYVPGYDPVPPRKYRERYRVQSGRQAAISGYEIALGPNRIEGRFGWHVRARIDGQETETDVEVLQWADIVRGSLSRSPWAIYGQLARTAAIYIGSGALFRLARLRKGPVIAALYPVAVLLAQLALALIPVVSLAWAGAALAGGYWSALPGPVAALAGALAGLWPAGRFLRRCQRRDRLLAWYLMADYAFSTQYGGAYPPAQEARLADFADRIAAALATDVDEVLVVGHSSGAYLAISCLADLLRAGRVPAMGPALGLLSLGQVVPMVSFLPKATRLRADLAFLGTSDALTWVDVTAPGDGCAFALCDPVAVSGVAQPGNRWPLVISAAFSLTLRPETWAALRRNPFEAHFQYLNAFDALSGGADDYDYFRITAGPLRLATRYGGRAPSKSRIETPVNRHTGIAE